MIKSVILSVIILISNVTSELFTAEFAMNVLSFYHTYSKISELNKHMIVVLTIYDHQTFYNSSGTRNLPSLKIADFLSEN